MADLDIDLNETSEKEVIVKDEKKISVWKKIKKFLINKYSVLLILSVIVGGGVVVGSIYYILKTGKETVTVTENVLLEAQSPSSNLSDATIPAPPDVKEFENPLNGQLLTKEEWEDMQKRPVVTVMVNNHVAARPQSGLDKADIVYEALAESGITRYMAVFWGPDSQEAAEIGPIRSIRQYFVDWAIEYRTPVVMHIGWAGYDIGIDTKIVPEADARSYILSHSNEMKSLQSGFWRDPNRVAPHDGYNSISNILGVARANNWGNLGSRESYKFKADIDSANRPEASSANISFLVTSPNTYSVRWEYNKSNNNYERYLAGVKHVDKITGVQLTAKNIVFQKINYKLANDEHARIVLTTVGTGDASYMLDGKVMEGKWEKLSKTSPTKYYDSNGEEMIFNRGKIWIEEIPVQNEKVVGILTMN